MRRLLPVMLLAVVSACAEVPSPPPASPGAFQGPVEATIGCPERPFDERAVLGPPFDQAIFVRGESRQIAEAFLRGLGGFYATPSVATACGVFTGPGLTAAVEADQFSRAAVRGELSIDGEFVLRLRYEHDHDLRLRPPMVAIDIIFDLAAGAAVHDLVAGTTRATTTDERYGFRVDFVYDGHRWWADDVGPLSQDTVIFARLPTPLAPGPPCPGIERDPPGAPFDADAGTSFGEGDGPVRPWCDAGGPGRLVQQRSQLSLFTRYPCGTGQAAILTIGRPLGAPIDPLVRWEYVRDPEGVFLANRWLTAPFEGRASLPSDASYSGWTNGNIDLWISPAELDEAIYVARGNVTERWPRAAESWGVTDCN